MAKVTKKLTKTKLKKTKKTEVAAEPVTVVPSIAPGLVSISLLPNELTTLTNLMSICAKIFEEQAMIAMQQGNEERFTILASRHKMSSMFADRFVEFCKIPEPESRHLH